MNDAENIISQIEQVLNSPEQTPMPQLQTIASQYAARCKELNDSMILVLNNIYANNYCEAVRAADEQHVLDDYNVLNFPGLSEWKQICATLGLAKPADLAEDLALRKPNSPLAHSAASSKIVCLPRSSSRQAESPLQTRFA